ncbi:hypothetical protein BDN71DRAFT_1435090 [Pleurotus eryngii]|uniref:Uncharacterized protein n=1 Tax=Pleurotus eryngii TaxID=5323 RepID=A0A9P6D2E7_PLEER|nr:hypothetical protein BDN71DRAFT_1435090 [Pleurotus eryngii]
MANITGKYYWQIWQSGRYYRQSIALANLANITGKSGKYEWQSDNVIIVTNEQQSSIVMKTTNELSKAQVKREWTGLQQVNECGCLLLQWPAFVVAKVAQCEVTGVGGRKWEWKVGMESKKMHDMMEREELINKVNKVDYASCMYLYSHSLLLSQCCGINGHLLNKLTNL